jgi:[acyl-carrier-protein] S-malonyltransferase
LEESSNSTPWTSWLSGSLERPPVGEPGLVLALVCPGQGSQSPGFLLPWLELPGVRERLEWLSAVAGIDLVRHGTTSDAATIQDTAVAQPLIVAGGVLAMPFLTVPEPDRALGGVPADVTAGHSVGEFTASVAAGVLTAEQAMVLVRERGRAMAEAAAVTATGMSAVLGGDPEDVLATLGRLGLAAANVNGAGQVVAAGTTAQLAELAGDPPARARVVPLKVAGAFHTHHMAPAVERLAALTAGLGAGDPRIPLLSNADGQPVTDAADLLGRLAAQVSGPVRWDLCLATLQRLGVTALIELPPAGTLTNLAKRALSGVEVLAVKTPDDLERARDLVKAHRGPAPAESGGRPDAGGTQ